LFAGEFIQDVLCLVKFNFDFFRAMMSTSVLNCF
jgi:hypothetical protein